MLRLAPGDRPIGKARGPTVRSRPAPRPRGSRGNGVEETRRISVLSAASSSTTGRRVLAVRESPDSRRRPLPIAVTTGSQQASPPTGRFTGQVVVRLESRRCTSADGRCGARAARARKQVTAGSQSLALNDPRSTAWPLASRRTVDGRPRAAHDGCDRLENEPATGRFPAPVARNTQRPGATSLPPGQCDQTLQRFAAGSLVWISRPTL